jgi:hypothetical protein
MEILNEELVKSLVENSKAIEHIESQISLAIAGFKKDLEERQVKEEEIRKALKESMIEMNVKKFENDVILINYIASTTKKTIDTTKLKEEKPELWEEYSKTSEVSDSIRIKIK